MGRILAIDYGRKRSGLAVSDNLKLIANGLCTVSTHQLLDYIINYISTENVDEIIIGKPKQMNYEDSENFQRIEIFVNTLKKRLTDIPVVYVDERFTSVLAHRAMIDAGLKKKTRRDKALVDKISAVIILQTYLESNNINNL